MRSYSMATLRDLQLLPISILRLLCHDLREAEHVLSLQRTIPEPDFELLHAMPVELRHHMNKLYASAIVDNEHRVMGEDDLADPNETYEHFWPHGHFETVVLLKHILKAEITARNGEES